MDWTAEVNQEEVPKSPTKPTPKHDWTKGPTEEQKELLPEIPEVVDEDWDIPDEVVIPSGKSDGTFSKYTWDIKADPKASIDEEYPDQVVIQTVNCVRVQKERVNTNVARRRKWKKYGMSAGDAAGPSPETTTLVSEDLPIIYANRKHLSTNQQITLNEVELQELSELRKTIVSQLKQHKLTLDKAPTTWKATEATATSDKVSFMDRLKGKGPLAGATESTPAAGGSALRRATTDMPSRPGRPGRNMQEDEGCTVRVTNLSENIVDGDLHDLFKSCGSIKRLYLARDKKTNRPKGFAYVTFGRPSEADKAVTVLHKYAFDHLILSVELSKKDKERA